MYVIKVKDKDLYVSFDDVLDYHLSEIPYIMKEKEEVDGTYEHCDPENSNFCKDEKVQYGDLEIREVEIKLK